ncbi:helix-turn-helix transcriptional regulator [Actinomyces qiguomingii]|uniref:helix-turn-helix transcriptional regulator n=1 Tax=Actinomyces qiguomingii TaxID=2057800 RepID=UPI000CA06258|nr:helix-turn-helix transcriptional regulator [Actinomyces qiguomingii]
MHIPDRRRLVAREIADRLSRGLGSFYLVAAPSVSGVWSLGPALAADMTELLAEVRVAEVDAAIGAGLPVNRPDLNVDDVLLITCIDQIFGKLSEDAEQPDLRARLQSLRNAVVTATSTQARSEAAADFAAAATCDRPVLVVVSVRGTREGLSPEQMRRAASLLATTPFAVVVLMPEGTVDEAAAPPFFSTSIRHLGPDDARDLIGAETSAYVDPMVAEWISRSSAGRICDIRAEGASLSGVALAGRELPRREPIVSAHTRRMVADRLRALTPKQRDALVAMHLQLEPDSAVARNATGVTPPQEAEDLLPAPEPIPGLGAALAVAVVQALPHEAVRVLHQALAESHQADTLEHSWHRLGAGVASVEDWDRLLVAADAELQHGSVNIAWRIIDALALNRAGRVPDPALTARIRLLQGQLALQLGCTLTASARLREAMGRTGLHPREELTVAASYIAARGSEGMSIDENSRLAARIVQLGEVEALPAARCLILLAAQERLIGETQGPGDYLRAAIRLLDADGSGDCAAPPCADTLGLAQALAARVSGQGHEASRGLLSGVFVEVPGDTARGDVAVWAQAVIHAVLAAEDMSGDKTVVAESVQSRLAGVSPFYEAQAVSLRAYLRSRLGWTRYAQAELVNDSFRVPLRAGLTGLGVAAVAQGAMLFGGATTAAAWRTAMASGLPGSAASPQQLWVGVLEAAARLSSGDGSSAGLLLGPAVCAGVARERLRPVWSSVVDMVIIEPALLERVPGLADWLRAQSSGRVRPDPDDQLLAVLLSDDAQAVPLISELLLDTALSGNALRQVRVDMMCAARLRRSPELDTAELGVAGDASSCAQVLEARATELAARNGMFFWQCVTQRTARSKAGAGPVSSAVAVAPTELTETELRVARLAARGRRNKEIAAETYMAVRTVELRLTGVYRALGISSRKDLPRALATHSLLED